MSSAQPAADLAHPADASKMQVDQPETSADAAPAVADKKQDDGELVGTLCWQLSLICKLESVY